MPLGCRQSHTPVSALSLFDMNAETDTVPLLWLIIGKSSQ